MKTRPSTDRPEHRRPKSAFYNHYDSLPARTDFRRHPELYRVGRGEQGVLIVEPYKSEILPHWRFATVAAARRSSAGIYRMFLGYLKRSDFVGADMARKFLQMGYTRARRYANHAGGQKYGPSGRALPRRPADPVKAAAAKIFLAAWTKARGNERYLLLKRQHQTAYG